MPENSLPDKSHDICLGGGGRGGLSALSPLWQHNTASCNTVSWQRNTEGVRFATAVQGRDSDANEDQPIPSSTLPIVEAPGLVTNAAAPDNAQMAVPPPVVIFNPENLC